MTHRKRVTFITLFLTAFVRTHGFNLNHLFSHTGRSFHLSSTEGYKNDSNSSQREHITSMILSLAAETDDNTRRQNLSTILKENLSQSDTVEAAKFAILWDKTVIEVGTKVQQEARMNAELRMMTHGDEQNKNDDMVNTNGSNENRTKSPEELKLWAMIDMMIQSKQIIKKMMAE